MEQLLFGYEPPDIFFETTEDEIDTEPHQPHLRHEQHPNLSPYITPCSLSLRDGSDTPSSATEASKSTDAGSKANEKARSKPRGARTPIRLAKPTPPKITNFFKK